MDRNMMAEEWICAFLEWSPIDDEAIEQPTYLLADAVDPWEWSAGDTFPAEREQFRESVLLDALHMESECVHILRQVLDRDSRAPETLQLALDVLRKANQLLGDEDRAWHALCEQHQWRLALTPKAAWEAHLERDWSQALDHVAADVHELTGRVLALQTYHA